jgi:MYXO-CTERM domain-containing protein
MINDSTTQLTTIDALPLSRQGSSWLVINNSTTQLTTIACTTTLEYSRTSNSPSDPITGPVGIIAGVVLGALVLAAAGLWIRRRFFGSRVIIPPAVTATPGYPIVGQPGIPPGGYAGGYPAQPGFAGYPPQAGYPVQPGYAGYPMSQPGGPGYPGQQPGFAGYPIMPGAPPPSYAYPPQPGAPGNYPFAPPPAYGYAAQPQPQPGAMVQVMQSSGAGEGTALGAEGGRGATDTVESPLHGVELQPQVHHV